MLQFRSDFASPNAIPVPQAPLGAPAASQSTPATNGPAFGDVLQTLAPSAGPATGPDADSLPGSGSGVAVRAMRPKTGWNGKNGGQPQANSTASGAPPPGAPAPATPPTPVPPVPPSALMLRGWAARTLPTPGQPDVEADALAAAVPGQIQAGAQTPTIPGTAAKTPGPSARTPTSAKATTPPSQSTPTTPPTSTAPPAMSVTAVAAVPDVPVPPPSPAPFHKDASPESNTAQPAASDDPVTTATLLAATATMATPLPVSAPNVPAPSAKGTSSGAANNTDTTETATGPANAAVTPSANRPIAPARALQGGAPDLDDSADEPAPAAPSATAGQVLSPTSAAASAVINNLRAAAALQASAPAAAPNAALATPPPTTTNPPATSTTMGNAVAVFVPGAKVTGAAQAAPAVPPTAIATPPVAPLAQVNTSTAFPDLLAGASSPSLSAPAPEVSSLAGPVDATSVMSQMVQAMRVQVAQGGGQADVTLQPGYLGNVSLTVKVDASTVSASVSADNPAVREALRSQEPALRQALSDQGLQLDRFEVNEPAETPRKGFANGNGGSDPDQQPRPKPKRQPSSDATFEVEV